MNGAQLSIAIMETTIASNTSQVPTPAFAFTHSTGPYEQQRKLNPRISKYFDMKMIWEM